MISAENSIITVEIADIPLEKAKVAFPFSSRATVFSNSSRVGLCQGVFLQKNKYKKFFAKKLKFY